VVAAAAAPIPTPALLLFAHPCSCSPLPFACWFLTFICVPAPVCTRPPACCSCLFMPTRLHAFVWPSFMFVWPTQPCPCPRLYPSPCLLFVLIYAHSAARIHLAFVCVCFAYSAHLFALAHAGPSCLCTPTLARTGPITCAGPCLFSVSHLLLLLPLGLRTCLPSAYFPSVCLLVPARLCLLLPLWSSSSSPLLSSLSPPSWAITWYLYQIDS
jgi:hypothetical protein